MLKNPLAQFEVHSLVKLPEVLGYNIDITNSTLYMFCASVLLLIFLVGGLVKATIVPHKWQSMVEMTYNALCDTLKSSVGEEGMKYRVIIFTLFMFILMCNLVGMFPIPHAFTPTSHVSITFALAIFVFIFCTFMALRKQGWGFFNIFLPQGTPWWLAPMMILVEVFAYFARPVSLSIRLSANMIAGHTILKVIAGFVLSTGYFFSIFPLAFVVLLIVFEIFIAILQAYIFVMLTCVYLSDSLNSH